MADDVIDGAEQATDPGAPADATDPEAVSDLTGGDAGTGAAEDAGALTDATETTAETLETFLARNEAARAEHEQIVRERENAGAQRREATLKKEAGRKDMTVRNVQRWAQDTLGVAVDDPSQLAYFYDLAAGHFAGEFLADTVPNVLLKDFNISVEAREAAVAARENGDWDGYFSHLVDGAVETRVAERAAVIQKQADAEVTKRVAAEIKARGIEKAPVRDGAPPAPRSGGSGGITPQELEAMPSEVFRAKPREEQERLIQEARAHAQRTVTAAR